VLFAVVRDNSLNVSATLALDLALVLAWNKKSNQTILEACFVTQFHHPNFRKR